MTRLKHSQREILCSQPSAPTQAKLTACRPCRGHLPPPPHVPLASRPHQLLPSSTAQPKCLSPLWVPFQAEHVLRGWARGPLETPRQKREAQGALGLSSQTFQLGSAQDADVTLMPRLQPQCPP